MGCRMGLCRWSVVVLVRGYRYKVYAMFEVIG